MSVLSTRTGAEEDIKNHVSVTAAQQYGLLPIEPLSHWYIIVPEIFRYNVISSGVLNCLVQSPLCNGQMEDFRSALEREPGRFAVS